MSRRFSDEPINLIHRIPTPEQLSAARRPSNRSFGQALMESGVVCVRGIVEVFAQVGRVAQAMIGVKTASPGRLDEHRIGPIADPGERFDEGVEQSEMVREWPKAVAASDSERDVNPLQLVARSVAVQPEEVAELRAYLLSQQQDIARLSAQIQELKSLVVSQQQVLVYLGKELEVSSLSPVTAGVASAPAKRNRPVRQSSGMKDKTVAQKDAPKSSSLSF